MSRGEGAEEAAAELKVGVQRLPRDQVLQEVEGRLTVLQGRLTLRHRQPVQGGGQHQLLAGTHHAARARRSAAAERARIQHRSPGAATRRL
jgi:hypothetical protein